MASSRGLLILLLMVFYTATAFSSEVWEEDLGKARQQAAKTGNLVLLFFSDPDAPLSAHNLRIWGDARVQREVCSGFTLVRLEFRKHQQTAHALNLFKAGSIAVYSSDGRPLLHVKEPVSAEELAKGLKETRKTAGQDASTTGTAGALLAGAVVARPFRAEMNAQVPMDLWMKRHQVRPPYNPKHVYEILVTGEGQPFVLLLAEKSMHNQSDNSGALVLPCLRRLPPAGPEGVTRPRQGGRRPRRRGRPRLVPE